MATLSLQDASAGLAPAMVAAAAGGDSIPSGTHVGGWALPVALVVRNAHTAAQSVTVQGLPAVSVPATNGIAVIPVAGKVAFGDLIPVTYSGVTALTVAAVKLLKVREE